MIAYRAALEERTRERVPLDWAFSLANQGVALIILADRKNNVLLAETAVQQIGTAYEALHSDGQVQSSVFYRTQLSKAHEILDRLKKR